MSVNYTSPEAPIRSILSAGLQRFIGPDDRTIAALVNAACHRVYTLTLPDIQPGGKGIKGAQPSGWRFLAGETGPPVAAEVTESLRDRPSKVRNLSRAPHLVQAHAAIRLAESLPQTRNQNYELRLLRIPGLLIEAIWLSAPRPADDLVLPFHTPRRQSDSLRVWKMREFLNEVRSLAATALDFDDSPRHRAVKRPAAKQPRQKH